MKTLILESPGHLIATDTPPPGPPGPGQARVRVHRIGVCGTDLHAYHGRQPFFSYPRILGHELGVEVLETGEGVHQVRPGDRCAVEPYLHCGRCAACRGGKSNCCATLEVLGVHSDGGHREEILVPAAKLHPANDLTYDQLALVETLAIGAHAVARANIAPGETAAVIGAGPIGLSAIQLARAAQARVIVVDVNPSRLAFCRDRLGIPADDLLDASTGEVVARLESLTGGDLPAAVLDATGNRRSMESAFRYPAHGGRLVFIGLLRGEVTFDDPDFHRRELTLLASRNALPGDFIRLLDLVAQGKIDTTPWITHRARLDAVPAVFESWTSPDTGVIKAVIEV